MQSENIVVDVACVLIESVLEFLLEYQLLKASKSAFAILEYLHSTAGLAETFRNTCIVVRIFLTFPVTVASAERSFSKLKLIKNYLRTSQTRERLSDLAI